MALEADGSNPSIHPIFLIGQRTVRESIRSVWLLSLPICFLMGCRQGVRQRTLTPLSVGSNPAIPARCFAGSSDFYIIAYDPVAQSAEHLPFKQGVRSSNLRWVTKNTTTCVVVFSFLTPSPASVPQHDLFLRRMRQFSQALQLAQHMGRRKGIDIVVF